MMDNDRKPLLPGSIQTLPHMQESVITTQFGIGPDGERVMLLFSQPVPNMLLTVEKAQEWCRNIQGVIDVIEGRAPMPGNPNG